jgi:flagellin
VADLTQGVANGNDAVAQLQIMDGGMNNIAQILDRLKTLAMQSASESFTGNRSILNAEFQNDISEIDRQAQSIGLNTGGTFAKSLAVYLGAGSGSTSTSNSVVNVDLATALVDSQSLGLNGFQAVNIDTTTVANDYDLGASSASSVTKIKAANSPTTATFKLRGPGFSDSAGAAAEITISVNLNGVGDTTSLVNNINAAIAQQEANAGSNYASFKKANIVASIHTDSLGRQQLAFTSANTAFVVEAGDVTANAFMGMVTGATGQAISTTGTTFVARGSYEMANPATSANPAAQHNLTLGASLEGKQTVTISAVDSTGVSHQLAVAFDSTNNAATMGSLAVFVDTINQKLQASNDTTLQRITAIQTAFATQDADTGRVNFISSVKDFSVAFSTATSAGGVTVPLTGAGFASDGVVKALQVGTGGAADISSIAGAQQAVAAITSAVDSLGSAQAAVGKGQNALGYAVNLAQSQITNLSSAEAQIRDANVAAEAANLSKAQVLQQASIAAMAQANSAPQAVLSLLRG